MPARAAPRNNVEIQGGHRGPPLRERVILSCSSYIVVRQGSASSHGSTSTGKSGTFSGMTTAGVCWPSVSSFTRPAM
ncbi:hypothetical protein [Candidatus Electronema sp. JM]|uniref:hypothetical protein n=1 Tax=Candidatus Electronema sp. JM TaxID=3401571 RepID=UPI003AA8DB9B